MPRRRMPTRDEFLNYLVAQRQGMNRNLAQSTSPVQRFSKLINQSPTNIILPNRQESFSDLLKRKRRAKIRPGEFQGRPVGEVTPLDRGF